MINKKREKSKGGEIASFYFLENKHLTKIKKYPIIFPMKTMLSPKPTFSFLHGQHSNCARDPGEGAVVMHSGV